MPLKQNQQYAYDHYFPSFLVESKNLKKDNQKTKVKAENR